MLVSPFFFIVSCLFSPSIPFPRTFRHDQRAHHRMPFNTLRNTFSLMKYYGVCTMQQSVNFPFRKIAKAVGMTARSHANFQRATVFFSFLHKCSVTGLFALEMGQTGWIDWCGCGLWGTRSAYNVLIITHNTCYLCLTTANWQIHFLHEKVFALFVFTCPARTAHITHAPMSARKHVVTVQFPKFPMPFSIGSLHQWINKFDFCSFPVLSIVTGWDAAGNAATTNLTAFYSMLDAILISFRTQ